MRLPSFALLSCINCPPKHVANHVKRIAVSDVWPRCVPDIRAETGEQNLFDRDTLRLQTYRAYQKGPSLG